MNNLFEQFADMGKAMYDLYESPRELAAIWLNQKVFTSHGYKRRICAGMLIHNDESNISVSKKPFNKEIIACYGTLINQFRIKVKDLETGIEEMIAL